MSAKEEARARVIVLTALRKENQANVARTQALVREQNAIRKRIRGGLTEGPKTVPELARRTGLPPDHVLWHITAMKKYDLVVEAGMDEAGEYYLYGLPEEAEQ